MLAEKCLLSSVPFTLYCLFLGALYCLSTGWTLELLEMMSFHCSYIIINKMLSLDSAFGPLLFITCVFMQSFWVIWREVLEALWQGLCFFFDLLMQVGQIYQKFECKDQSDGGIVRNVVRWSIENLLEVNLVCVLCLLAYRKLGIVSHYYTGVRLIANEIRAVAGIATVAKLCRLKLWMLCTMQSKC